MLALARARRPLPGAAVVARSRAAPPIAARAVAIARGPAFSFHYEENLELLRAAGRRARAASTR